MKIGNIEGHTKDNLLENLIAKNVEDISKILDKDELDIKGMMKESFPFLKDKVK